MIDDYVAFITRRVRKIAQNNAAVQIQSVQRRKAAMSAARTRRRVKELQRRKSAEIAAVSIQRVVRGRVARAATQAEIERREVRGPLCHSVSHTASHRVKCSSITCLREAKAVRERVGVRGREATNAGR